MIKQRSADVSVYNLLVSGSYHWEGGMSWLDVSPSQHFSRYPKCGVSVALLSPHTVTSGALRKVCKIRPWISSSSSSLWLLCRVPTSSPFAVTTMSCTRHCAEAADPRQAGYSEGFSLMLPLLSGEYKESPKTEGGYGERENCHSRTNTAANSLKARAPSSLQEYTSGAIARPPGLT